MNNTPPTDPLSQNQRDLQPVQEAALRCALALDDAHCRGVTSMWTTEVLLGLDAFRVTAAAMHRYFPMPVLSEHEAAFAKAVAMTSEMLPAGPTQDQEPSPTDDNLMIGITAIEDYRAGLCSIEECEIELHRMIREEAERLREQQATREAADNGAWLPALMGAPDVFEK